MKRYLLICGIGVAAGFAAVLLWTLSSKAGDSVCTFNLEQGASLHGPFRVTDGRGRVVHTFLKDSFVRLP